MRLHGQVFTPTPLIHLMLELAGLQTGASLSVLDPACGSGALLLGAASRLGPGGRLTGIDRDPRVLELARASLSELLEHPVNTGVSLDPSRPVCLQEADALTQLETLAGGFDLILSNPPYVAWHTLDATARAQLTQPPFQLLSRQARAHHADRQPGLELFFLLLGLHSLRPGGRLVYLLPQEWLSSPRAAPLRERLLCQTCLRQLLLFGPEVRLFERGPGQKRVGTSSALLVLDAQLPEAESRLEVGRLREADLEAWGQPGGQPGGAGKAGQGAAWSCLEQARLDEGPWTPERLGLRVGKGPKPPREGQEGDQDSPVWQRACPLGELPGVRVLGGHQPPVSWLAWLELSAQEVAGLPEGERHWVYPALAEAHQIALPFQTIPEYYWVFLPEGLSLSAATALAPTLVGLMGQKRARALRGVSLEREKTPVDRRGRRNGKEASEGRAEAWWSFPNRRNMGLLSRDDGLEEGVVQRPARHPGGRGMPRLLAPRTARGLQVGLDLFGHMIKGTNSLVILDNASPVTLNVLFGLLNSPPWQAWAWANARQYHGVRVLQEPQDLRRIPIPLPERAQARGILAALDAEVDRLRSGISSLAAVNAIAVDYFRQSG